MKPIRSTRPRPSTQALSSILAGLLALATVPASTYGASIVDASQTAAATGDSIDPTHVQQLGSEKIERPFVPGQTHEYTIDLQQGEFIQIDVRQLGVDLAVSLASPDGVDQVHLDSPNGYFGRETLVYRAKSPGRHRVLLSTQAIEIKSGAYQIELVEKRGGRDDDAARLDVQTTFCEAARAIQALVDSGDPAGLSEALVATQTAAKSARAGGDTVREAHALILESFPAELLADSAAAERSAVQAVALLRETTERPDLAVALESFGMFLHQQRRYDEAIGRFKEAVALFQEIGDRYGEGACRKALAEALGATGARRAAIEQFDAALALFKQTAIDSALTYTLARRGGMLAELGDYQQALDGLSDAKRLAESADDPYALGIILNDLGAVYDNLGELDLALRYYKDALKIQTALRVEEEIGLLYFNIGTVDFARDKASAALRSYVSSIRHYRAGDDPVGLSRTLCYAALVRAHLGQRAVSRRLCHQAIQLSRRANDPVGEARSLDIFGSILGLTRRSNEARAALDQALAIRVTLQDARGQAQTHYNIASVERGRGDLVEARVHIEQAIALIENIRSRIANRELRSSYFSTVQSYYELYIDILLAQHALAPKEGYDAQAFEASERARARGMLDLLVDSRANIAEGADPKLFERERLLAETIGEKADLRLMAAAERRSEDLAALDRELDRLEAEYSQVRDALRASSPKYTDLVQPRILGVKDVQRELLDDDSLLLEFSLGAERSVLWAISSTSLSVYELPRRAEIEASARRVYALISRRRSPDRDLTLPEPGSTRPLRHDSAKSLEATLDRELRLLGDALLKGVGSQLGTKRLFVVADGALQYVPFAALTPVGESEPLVVTHEIVTLPSASTLASLRSAPPRPSNGAEQIAVVADPVFSPSDERVQHRGVERQSTNGANAGAPVSRSVTLDDESPEPPVAPLRRALRIPRLPGTRNEAERIATLAGRTNILQAMDFDASRDMVMNADLRPYTVVHFATHGVLDAERPEYSAILLSMVDAEGRQKQGFLRVRDAFNLRLNADLVVLSACQTGLGREIRGEGMVGLTRGFMYSGARRVVVSLWNVDDRATADLMAAFYRFMVVEHRSPAAALREAQRSLIQQKQWRSPYYWAPFVVIGDA